MKFVAGFLLTTMLLSRVQAQQTTEKMYVSDKLVVGVFSEADNENDKLANLETGDVVDLLERQEKYLRVRMADGREGWVRATYLTKQAPAIVRLKELQAERSAPSTPALPSSQITQEIARLKEQNLALQTERDALQVATSKSLSTAPAKITEPEMGAAIKSNPPENRNPSAQTLSYAGVVLVLGALLGFLLGYQTLARRIRRKYGNVKIY